jgi:hypothetical protein
VYRNEDSPFGEYVYVHILRSLLECGKFSKDTPFLSEQCIREMSVKETAVLGTVTGF